MMPLWSKLSLREKGLALAVAAMLALGALYLVVSSALAHLERQEADLDRLEQQLVNYSRHMERQQPVNKAFGQIAAQHSSEWTGEEIYDRLGSEVYRLARENPGLPGSAGSGREIVPIPQLPPGELTRNPEGYRAYTVEFKTGDSALPDLIAFLRRLEESPQALRIESLDIRRSPDQLGIAQATIRVNRTVVDGVEEVRGDLQLADVGTRGLLPALSIAAGMEIAPNGSFEKFEGDGRYEGWLTEACRMAPATTFVTDGEFSARVEPTGSGAMLSQPLDLLGGATYEMSLDVMSTAPLSIAVFDQADDFTYDGVVQVSPDGDLRTYAMVFTVSGQGARRVHAPLIAFDELEGVVHLDRVRVRRIAGAK